MGVLRYFVTLLLCLVLACPHTPHALSAILILFLLLDMFSFYLVLITCRVESISPLPPPPTTNPKQPPRSFVNYALVICHHFKICLYTEFLKVRLLPFASWPGCFEALHYSLACEFHPDVVCVSSVCYGVCVCVCVCVTLRS